MSWILFKVSHWWVSVTKLSPPEFDITEIAKILFQLGLRDFRLGFFLLLIENILNKESIKPAIARHEQSHIKSINYF